MLKKLSQHSQRLSSLNHILQQALPPQYSAHCRLANIKHNTVVIQTDNASYASLIRFQAPVLCKALSEQLGQTLSHVEVKVKPHHMPLSDTNNHTISLPESAAQNLAETAQGLEQGPLKAALEKLARRRS